MTSSDDVINALSRAHALVVASPGEVPTERHLHSYREALHALVRLARNEYALGMVQDMRQVDAAMKD
jgi:hypothetical protein